MYKFTCEQLPEAKAFFDEHGYAVIQDVLNEDELELGKTGFSDYLAEVRTLYPEADFKEIYQKFRPVHGILQYPPALSHATFVEAVRESDTVAGVFNSFYGVPPETPTAASYDRINYQPAPSELGRKYRRRPDWWHVDQSAGNSGFQCIQGYLDIHGTPTEAHAGLQVVDQSHACFQHLADCYPDPAWNRTDWSRFTREDLSSALPDWDQSIVNVTSDPGDLVLWDSRTLHQSRVNTSDPNSETGRDSRLVFYTAHMPQDRLSDEDRARRQDFYDNYRTSSHWPDCRRNLRLTQTWGVPLDPTLEEFTRTAGFYRKE